MANRRKYVYKSNQWIDYGGNPSIPTGYVSSPVSGQVYYDPTAGGVLVYDGSKWVPQFPQAIQFTGKKSWANLGQTAPSGGGAIYNRPYVVMNNGQFRTGIVSGSTSYILSPGQGMYISDPTTMTIGKNCGEYWEHVAVTPPTKTTGAGSSIVPDVVYGTQFIATFGFGTAGSSTYNQYFKSSDGLTWTSFTPSGTLPTTLRKVRYLNGQYVGWDTTSTTSVDIYTSSNGESGWSKSATQISYASTISLQDMAYGSSAYVGVSTRGLIYVTSALGQTWVSKANSQGASDTIFAVEYGNGIFVAVGQLGVLQTSSDGGNTWSLKTSGTSNGLRGAAYGNGTWVVVGDSGVILSSTDNGSTWTQRYSSGIYPYEKRTLNAIIYAGDTFVAVGLNASILTSSDGINWTTANSPETSQTFYSAAYGNGAIAIPHFSTNANIICGPGFVGSFQDSVIGFMPATT